MSVGEGSAVMVDDVAKFVDPAREELNMLYHFDAARIRNTTLPDNPESGIDYSLIALKKMFTEWDKAVDKGWPSIYLGNHDQPRMVSRFGSDKDEFRALSAKMLITFLLTMRGTPYWFAGDEIGSVTFGSTVSRIITISIRSTAIRKRKQRVKIRRRYWTNRKRPDETTPALLSNGIARRKRDLRQEPLG